MNLSLPRLICLIKKEVRQLMLDKSMLWAAVILPILLLAIYGWGMRTDVEPVRTAVVVQEDDPTLQQVITLLSGTRYIEVHKVYSEQQAHQLLVNHDVDLLLRLSPSGGAGPRELFAAGISSSSIGAQLSVSYIQQALQSMLNTGGLKMSVRLWYNEENRSVWYLLPGQMVGIITLVCNVLCSMVFAREFDRGTIETLISSRASILEMILGKLFPYYALTMGSTVLLLTLSFVIFELPLRGNILLFVSTVALYALACCIFGLWISALVREQYQAMQYAIIMSFLPAILLSGAVYDLRAVPAAISTLSYLLHPTYAVQSLKICYLSGGQEDVLLRNLGIIFGYCALFWILLYREVKSFKESMW